MPCLHTVSYTHLKDETAQLTAEVIPSYADNTRVTWKSSDENVVTVDEKGKVKMCIRDS